LSSGSAGNSLFIESGDTRILIDAGLSERALAARLRSIGRDPGDLDAVFLTHEHSDHVRGVGPLARKHRVPVYSTCGTFKRIKHGAGRLPEWFPLTSGTEVVIGGLRLEPYSTEHDAEESVAFVIRSGSRKLGHATDLGVVTPLVRERLQGCAALLVEANHDPGMLAAGPYPWPLKRRIEGGLGHLSNEACADLLESVRHDRLRFVVLMHLSETNNLPEIARLTAARALADSSAQMLLARQDVPTPLLEIP